MSHSRRPKGALIAALLATLFGLAVFAAGPFGAAHADEDHSGHGGTTKPVPPDTDRCDLGFNTKQFNDYGRTGTQASVPGTSFKGLFMSPLTWKQQAALDKPGIARSIFGWAASAQMLDGRKAAGHLTHPLVDSWNAITDPVICNQLKNQLEATRAYVAKYPKLGDAIDDGMEFITPWFAGAGAHVGRWDTLDDKIEIGKPEVLIYDGNGRDSSVVGAMYSVLTPDAAAPKGVFAGGNDSWHQHKGLCWTSDKKVLTKLGLQPGRKVVLGGEAADDTWCKGVMKGKVEPFNSLYMMHVWVAPGCSSKYGVFSHDLPYLTYRNYVTTAHKPEAQGCGSNLPITAPLTGFETNELNFPGDLSTYQASSLSWSQGGSPVATGPVAAKLTDHPGAAHADGEAHLSGTLEANTGFSGPAGSWPVSFLRETDGSIHGSLTTPSGTVATFPTAAAAKTDHGVLVTATATIPDGTAVQLSIEIADPGRRGWFLDPVVVAEESLAIHHPAHGHDHAAGKVTYALSTHPGSAHAANEEHLFGTATTKDGFEGTAGAWTVSFVKNTVTNAISGYVKSPDALKTFNFTVADHHAATECAGGVHINATGAEVLTPTDPQNPELVICDPAVTAFFASHDHSGTTPTTPASTTPAATTPEHTH